MELKKGDILKIDFTAKLAAANVIFETTSKEIAKESGIYDEKVEYKPRLIFYQMNDILPGLEKALTELDLNEEKEIKISAENGFGKRNPDLLRTLPRSEFAKRGYEPSVGMQIDVNGSIGTVRAISGGRVVVDFNHPLAGFDLIYKVKLLQVIHDASEKLKALINEIGISKCNYSIKDDVLFLEFMDAQNNEEYVKKKTQLLLIIQNNLHEFKKLEVKEVYEFNRQ